MDAKNALSSLTLWFNAIVGAAAVIVPHLETIQGFLPGSIQPYVAGVLVVGNFILRFRTSQPVTLLKR